MSNSEGPPDEARPQDTPPTAPPDAPQPYAGQPYPPPPDAPQPYPGQPYPPPADAPPPYTQPYAQPTYPPPAMSPAAYPPGPYAAAPAAYSPPNNSSALVLTIVSGIAVLFCAGLFVIPALILGIVGLTKQSTDPEGSRRLSRYGWWAFGAGVLLTVLAVAAIVGFFITVGDGSGTGGSTTFDGY